MRCVSMNPVRAGLVERAEEWRWSSVGSHLTGKDNALVKVAPVLDRYGDFATFLAQEDISSEAFKRLCQSETAGRPLGSEGWIDRLSALTGRELKEIKCI